MTTIRAIGLSAILLIASALAAIAADPSAAWRGEWPRTDFSKRTVDLAGILSGGPPRDGIPPIDDPMFQPGQQAAAALGPEEPVVSVILNDDARAYPLRVLMWHEIVNDTVGGVPVAVTYCPLCNTSIVFDRRVGGRVLDFGTTGKLRHSDLVMYDRQTESWWQQFGGDAIVGTMVGTRLPVLASRLESVEAFRARAPNGKILVPRDPGRRSYGSNPYVGYDTAARPFLFDGEMPPGGVQPMMRVVAIGAEAWALPLLRARGVLTRDDLRLSWKAGQRSALGSASIARGADVGNVVVQRNGADVPYTVTFAFAFFAFNPAGVLHTEAGPVAR